MTIRSKLEVVPIENKMRENRLSWYSYVLKRPTNAIVQKNDKLDV